MDNAINPRIGAFIVLFRQLGFHTSDLRDSLDQASVKQLPIQPGCQQLRNVGTAAAVFSGHSDYAEHKRSRNQESEVRSEEEG
jgi:hypothetical protein